MTTVSAELRARFAALAALECPRCHGAGTWMGSGSFTQNYQERSCSACLGTGRRYPMLSEQCPRCEGVGRYSVKVPIYDDEDYVIGSEQQDDEQGCLRCHGAKRASLRLDTAADRQRAVGALVEVLETHNIRVSWDRGTMFVYRDKGVNWNWAEAECIAEGPSLVAMVMALEALEVEEEMEQEAGGVIPDDTPHYAMSPVAQGEAITEAQADMRLRDAAQDAASWLRAFGWNRYGIACQDDFYDHAPILAALDAALGQAGGHPEPSRGGATGAKRDKGRDALSQAQMKGGG